MHSIRFSALAAAAVVGTFCLHAQAAPAEYTSYASWAGAVGAVSSINFDTLPDTTAVTTQYSGQGVVFSDGDDRVLSSGSFLTDNKGIDAFGAATLVFSTTQTSIGFDFPGALHIDLFLGAAPVYVSSNFAGAGAGFFAGITGVSFDRAVVSDWVDSLAYVDNVHLAGAVPEPASVALMFGGLGVVGWLARRRRD